MKLLAKINLKNNDVLMYKPKKLLNKFSIKRYTRKSFNVRKQNHLSVNIFDQSSQVRYEKSKQKDSVFHNLRTFLM